MEKIAYYQLLALTLCLIIFGQDVSVFVAVLLVVLFCVPQGVSLLYVSISEYEAPAIVQRFTRGDSALVSIVTLIYIIVAFELFNP